MRIAVFGLGNVGLPVAACLARDGHEVAGVEIDRAKADLIAGGVPPFEEPGLRDLLGSVVARGALTVTTEAGEALLGANLAMLCVGTPVDAGGAVDLGPLRRCLAQVAADPPGAVVVRSTLPPGAMEEVVVPSLPGVPAVLSMPEFLREGSALSDLERPSLVVFGGRGAAEEDPWVEALTPAGAPAAFRVPYREAGTIKLAANAFHAAKVAFANEVAAVAETVGADGSVVMRALASDVRLNASSAYLRPGAPFGGSCLPKDLRALEAASDPEAAPLLHAIRRSNERRLEAIARQVLSREPGSVGIVGLAYKEGIDDVRESPAVELAATLAASGVRVLLHDPGIDPDRLTGQNLAYLDERLPAWRPHLVGAQEVMAAELLVVFHEGIAARLGASGPSVLRFGTAG